MWQKKLKQLMQNKPNLSEPTASKTHAAKSDSQPQQQEVNFVEYCSALGVTPLSPEPRVLTPPSSDHRVQRQPAQSAPNHRKPAPHPYHGWDFIDEENVSSEFFRFGQKNLPKELQRGKFKVNQTIDLHQHTKSQALAILAELVADAPASWVIKIIHGQGLNSAHNQPVLLAAVRKYLSLHSRVLGFSRGASAQGGNGVTLVKLCS
jgi:DNA-nicking Smr family endonuclease